MKKSLLFSAAIAVACSAFAAAPSAVKADISKFEFGPKAPAFGLHSATRASETREFSYSQGIYSLTKLTGVTGGKTRVYLFFEMNQNDIKGLAGSKVTGFSVVSSSDQNMRTNTINEGRFFYSLDLTKEDYTQDFAISSTPFDLNTIAMDTPYTITGEEEGLFFGYSFMVPKADNMYYIPYDGYSNPYMGSGVFAFSNTNAFPTDFYSFASDLGALSMSLTVEGENFPDYAVFSGIPEAVYLQKGKDSSATVSVFATSPDPIESVEFQYVLGGKEYTSAYEFSEPLPAGAGRCFSAPVEFPAQSDNLNENVTIKIAKMNGHSNDCDGSSVELPVIVLNEVPVHQTLYEEYTGTWCGYCPRGFAALEYIRENYPEFVCASFHSGTQGAADPMQVTSNFPSAVSGFPSAVLNRSMLIDPYDGTGSYNTELPVVGDILALNAVGTPWKVTVSHAWASDEELVAKAEVANMVGFENGNYRIAYLLVADGLTGTSRTWFQSNYYNTEQPQFIPELNAFCRGGQYGKGTVAGLVFNDVVVSADGIHGVNGSVPASLKAEEVAEYSMTFDLSKIKSDLIPDKKKLRVIAAVLDGNGNVLNCAKDEVNDDPSAVENIGNVDNAPVEYFNLSGMKVVKPADGIFIRRQGGKTE
ncbi:MAG: hypothetical protein K2H22_00115, partial [Muribaculaceae bacterium]|nr:hypothetical protein [Muribaculaceae bacterium]